VSANLFLVRSRTYSSYRRRFLEAAQINNLPVESHANPAVGLHGEQLFTDVALQGNPAWERLLVVSSGCHGIEGYCGSECQVGLLENADWLSYCHSQRVSVLYVHAVNPYGMSHYRRVDEDGVDVNRNFRDFSSPLPRNIAYEAIAGHLVPKHWPPSQHDREALAAFVAHHGQKYAQAAITIGQHTHPGGLFFAGTSECWSNRTVRSVIRPHARSARRLSWIDLHTGLGPQGHAEYIFSARDDGASLARAKRWWGDKVTSIFDGSSVSSPISGTMLGVPYDECPDAEYTSVALEIGTQPLDQVLNALRADHWLSSQSDADASLAQDIREGMCNAFYVDDDGWRRSVLGEARQAAFSAVAGLSSVGVSS
jgi:hypothetical protein